MNAILMENLIKIGYIVDFWDVPLHLHGLFKLKIFKLNKIRNAIRKMMSSNNFFVCETKTS